MLTRWGRELDPAHPLPEHPRPQLVRTTEWVNLNGPWSYAFGTADRPTIWDGEIVVPFSPETELSGVGRQLQPDEWLWYQRTCTAPEGDRVLLHFGAVDQSCTVWVNGHEVGTHTGGYLPFTLDITDALVVGLQTVEVRVRDLSETGPHARGKQRLDRGRIWYTAQSGIWQTVWLEAVPAAYIESLAIVPDLAAGALEVTVQVTGFRQAQPAGAGFAGSSPPPVEPVETTVTVLDHGTPIATATGPVGSPLRATIPDPQPWSPDDPFLYDLAITCGADQVTSFAALRSFGTGADERGRPCFLLNGAPFQHVGVLDQGYWPDGLMTAPSDAAMIHDIATMKSLGFTMLRKHAKIEPLRWYHHCDRLGILVWQDIPNGGGRYRELVANVPARVPSWVPFRLSDRRYDVFFRSDSAARAEFREEVRRAVALLRNVVAIAVWTPFNEGWGQFDANDVAAEVAALDPTRSVNHVSGWIDQGGGDIRSYHSYLRPFRLPRRRRDPRVPALTEYGGYSLVVDGHDASAVEFGYRHFDDAAGLAAGFAGLHSTTIATAVRRGLAATVYTQLSDVEDELNGLLTWDREVQKIPTEVVRAALASISR
ncbi:MAG TPA: glycoside hydrolase family 2 TIM barrel-domain containing protein [Marmoricola sp.]|jgi:beta-galactosidase/beta-glucuronidase|nr:glycoside hydrolase family 2 TIM barrel-domain containing protein [Marmoricola sp.]